MDTGACLGGSALPSTVVEVENLILELYQPGPPRKIAKIQESLQRLQKSPQGWQLASRLLECDDEKVKFFGALTFTVKLNSDSASLSALDVKALLSQLINWLIRCLDQDVGPLVSRKLCSTLVVYFLHFSESWAICIKHLIHSLYVGEAVPTEWLEHSPDITIPAGKLSAEKALAVLWFSTGLAEEVGKTDASHIKFHKFHERLMLNVVDIVTFMGRCLIEDLGYEQPQTKLRQEAMKCFQSWVLYSHRAFVDTGITMEPLKTLTKVAIACLAKDEMYGVTVELFSDILSNYSRFLANEDLELLFALFNSQWSRGRYERLLQGDFDFDSLQFGQFMIAFGHSIVQDLARRVDSGSQQFLTALAGLLTAKGYVVAEDRIFVSALEFWSTFVEVMIDSLYSEGDVGSASTEIQESENCQPPGEHSNRASSHCFSMAKAQIMNAIEYSWYKIQFPPSEIFDSWDSVDRIGFSDARKDVADLLQSSYTIVGASLFSLFANLTVQSLQEKAWEELEASLFCLGTLSDCIDQDTCDNDLSRIFASPFFRVLLDDDTKSLVRARQTTLSLLGQYDSYFERHTENLPHALNFLFKGLITQTLSGTASRSIQSLCSLCRHTLINELDVFLQKYEEFVSHPDSDSLIKERIVNAIASIVQAIPTEEKRKSSLSQLLQHVEADFKRCLELMAASLTKEAEALGVETLRCLASIAKGLQAPSDIPLDLENTESHERQTQFWTTGAGAAVQKHIQTIVERLMGTFPRSGDMVEAACNMFRAGFTERLPGPFVFLPSCVVEFLLKANSHTPRIGSVVSMACSLVSSCTVRPSGQVDDAIRKLLTWLLLLLQDLGEPAYDPEIAQTGIDFIYRLLPTYVHVLMELPPARLEAFFVFVLQALTGRDPLPKSAAADFWGHFITLANLPTPLQTNVNTVIQHMGPAIAEALIYSISGNAARSELDKLSEPLKKLVVSQVRSRLWLEGALFNQKFPMELISNDERRIFLQKIIRLRGAKQTNQVVKDFWLVCRGSNFAYAS